MISSDLHDLLYDEKALVYVALVQSNGLPHVTPVWFDIEDVGEGLVYMNINIATKRVKSREIVVGKDLALVIQDPGDLYRYVGFYGVVEELERDELHANLHKDALSEKYLGLKKFPYHREGERRIKVKIRLVSKYADKKRRGKN